jgi:hypothetical protein
MNFKNRILRLGWGDIKTGGMIARWRLCTVYAPSKVRERDTGEISLVREEYVREGFCFRVNSEIRFEHFGSCAFSSVFHLFLQFEIRVKSVFADGRTVEEQYCCFFSCVLILLRMNDIANGLV